MERARLYVSISPDLAAEREAIGRAVANLPVDVGWEVSYTPGATDPNAADPRTAARAHVYILALGEDIRAPMGVEWDSARRVGLKPLALLHDGPRTPAAQAFLKGVDVEWTSYKSARELTHRVQAALAQALLDRAPLFGLSTPEWESLSGLLKTLQEQSAAEGEDERSGAGQSGVIFAPSREAGKGGIVVGESRKPR
ncbi:MAG: hypothetical protein U0822_12710 [Anaerolineae bacterium]